MAIPHGILATTHHKLHLIRSCRKKFRLLRQRGLKLMHRCAFLCLKVHLEDLLFLGEQDGVVLSWNFGHLEMVFHRNIFEVGHIFNQNPFVQRKAI